MTFEWEFITPMASLIFIGGGILGAVSYVLASYKSGVIKSDHELTENLKLENELLRKQVTERVHVDADHQRQLNSQAAEIARLVEHIQITNNYDQRQIQISAPGEALQRIERLERYVESLGTTLPITTVIDDTIREPEVIRSTNGGLSAILQKAKRHERV